MTCRENAGIWSTDLGEHLLPHHLHVCEAGPLKQTPSCHVWLVERGKVMEMHRQILMQVQKSFFLLFFFFSFFPPILNYIRRSSIRPLHPYVPDGLKGRGFWKKELFQFY